MANVIDGANSWPCTLGSVAPKQVTVTMAGDNGLNAVCTGKARPGKVQDQGRSYDVRLPGAFAAGTRHATFNRS